MNDLRAELDQLEDNRLDYVIERSKVSSDARAYRNCGISKSSFYSWELEEREKLNNIAQKLKRESALRALLILQDATEAAAQVKVDGLESRKETIKQNSATEILDRMLGRPTQKQEITGADGGPMVHKVKLQGIENIKPYGSE